MVHEIRASIKLTNITRHMVTKDFGIAIGATRNGAFGVANVARIGDMGLTYMVMSTYATEAKAREVANQMWVNAKEV